MKIDIFTHVSPLKYNEALARAGSSDPRAVERSGMGRTPLSDPVLRFEIMDQLEDMAQVLTLVEPPIEQIVSPEKAVELARIANDEMAELVAKYPDRFVAAVAALPLNNMDAALEEADRAINDLKVRGVQIFSSVNNRPLDSPEFLPLYEKMAQCDLPIWIHPVKPLSEPDYPGEQGSKYGLAAVIGWPHMTSMAMLRLAYGGVLERFPNLKFITHHDGGTVPYLAKRIEYAPYRPEGMTKPVTDYLRLFYNDTAVQGNTANLMCSCAFCGTGHILFGTDFPMASVNLVREVIRSIEEMDITDADRQEIFSGNARRLLRLTA